VAQTQEFEAVRTLPFADFFVLAVSCSYMDGQGVFVAGAIIAVLASVRFGGRQFPVLAVSPYYMAGQIVFVTGAIIAMLASKGLFCVAWILVNEQSLWANYSMINYG
jgi:hypothetical protein